MAISVDPLTFVIYVPKSDLTPLGGSRYELDANWLRLQLRDWEDSETGIVFSPTHNHNTTVTLSGVTYARVLEMLTPYTIEFEDGQYSVAVTGANTNIADVKVVNQVSLIIGNSAGLITVASGSGLSAEQHRLLRVAAATTGGKTSGPTPGTAGTVTVRDIEDTEDLIVATVDAEGYRTAVTVAP
jgi:hypothetical protein